ncbi:MAG: hypothetical protein KUL87_10620 [Pseudomonas sp.]|nr:hypothetical protein [Pseudomonas sp.]
MNDTLKAAGRIGAELGAAKAEVERLREALRPFAAFEAVRSKQGGCTPKRGTAWAVASAGEEAEITVEHLQASVSALSQQAEPCVFHDSDREACQQYSGQVPCEPAPAQDEKAAFDDWYPLGCPGAGVTAQLSALSGFRAGAAWQRTRPAQTEQQPACDVAPPHWWIDHGSHGQITQRRDEADSARAEGKRVVRYAAALIAQTEQQPSGWKLVPVELTQEMSDAGRNLLAQGSVPMSKVFRAILDAAPIAQTAPQPEQSGIVGQVCGGDGTHNTVNVAVVGPVPWGDLRIGTPVRLIPAPAQGAGDASA